MDHCPPCQLCGAATNFAHSDPHPDLEDGWELLAFECTGWMVEPKDE